MKKRKLMLLQNPFPADNLKKYNKNDKPNKDIFLHPKILNKQQDDKSSHQNYILQRLK